MHNHPMASRFTFVFILIVFLGSLVSLASAEEQSQVAAKVGGKQIMIAELDKASKSSLIPLQAEIYQVRKTFLDQMVSDALYQLEAEAQGKSADEIKKSLLNRDAIAVSEGDIQKFYQDNKYYFKDQPLEGIKEPIRQRIIDTKARDLERQVVSGLRKKFGVEVFLQEPKLEIETRISPARGPQNAKITLNEFSDFQCPYCARFSDTVNQLVADFPVDVRHVFHHNPLPMHSNAMAAHHASVCAQRQGKFWEFRDILFDHQAALAPTELRTYAESIGINLGDYDKCVADSSIDEQLSEEVSYATSVGADGTPTSFLNGRLLSGARPYEEVKAMVEEILQS